MNALQTELFLLCLIATLATFVAAARDDAFFTALFATASSLVLTYALRSGGTSYLFTQAARKLAILRLVRAVS
jgi:hypothetical protein